MKLFAVFIFLAVTWGFAGWLRLGALKQIEIKEDDDV